MLTLAESAHEVTLDYERELVAGCAVRFVDDNVKPVSGSALT